MSNKLILILLMLFLSHCGYSSIYSNENLKDISINITDIQGDKDINKVIERKLERYKKNQSANEFNIIIEKSGKVTNVKINKNFIMSKIDDILEEKKYEVTIKDNLINSVTEEMIRKLLTI